MTTSDHDHVIEVVKAHDVERTRVNAGRVLLVLLALAVIAVVAGWMFRHRGFDSRIVPAEVVGLWTTADPDYSDRYLDLQPDTITFGTGGTSFVKYSIIGVVRQKVGEDRAYDIHFRGVDGATFRKEIVLSASGDTLFFKSQPEVVWARFKG